MPSPKRRPKVYTAGDLSIASLMDKPYWALVQLAEKGTITWSDVGATLHARMLRHYGGRDPYAHLRPIGDEE